MSQCARVLEVLADGLPHSVPEIHERAGTMRLNSRIAELRTQGHVIRCVRIEGETGAASYSYVLENSAGIPESGAKEEAAHHGVDFASFPAEQCSGAAVGESAVSGSASCVPSLGEPERAAPVQMTLLVAA